MAMTGVRDMSVLSEPPENRYPVQTYVLEDNPAVIADAVRNELSRGGQVFYLYNRVQGIYLSLIHILKNSKGEVVILNGDTPLITAETINKAIEYHKNNDNQATVITAILDDATGYGRIVRDNDGSVLKIVEQKDASEEEKKINEVNSGMYVFDAQSLVYALDKITPNLSLIHILI